MHLPAFIENGYLDLTDTLFAHVQRQPPSPERLRRCKIISHRGDHDNTGAVLENTIVAFERAQGAGVWGIELDIRWTRDMEPVVFHDQDLFRLYGVEKKIWAFTRSELKEQYPAIPALSEVVRQFGKKCHLMIEVKMQPWLNRAKQVQRLEQILAHLEPGTHYHLITSHPEVLSPFHDIPLDAKVAIAMQFPGPLSKWVERHRWGGLCGHYSLIGTKAIKIHHHRGRKIGTGYIQSRNCLFREVNRGIDWIFSNDAVGLQQILDSHLTSYL